jgi:protein-disulfide isomerase
VSTAEETTTGAQPLPTNNGTGEHVAETTYPDAPPPPAKKKISGEVKLFISILVGALILGGAAIYPTLKGPPTPQSDVTKIDNPDINRAFLIPANSHILGDPNAKFSVVEFSDLQCPSCKKAVPELAKALKEQRGKFNVVFRHFQAAASHAHSRTLGIASEAAGAQGKFYQMCDKIFGEQEKYEAMQADEVKDMMVHVAADLHLDVARFKKDMDSPQVIARYDNDQAAGDKAKIVSTPYFFFVPPTGKATGFTRTPDLLYWVKQPENYK